LRTSWRCATPSRRSSRRPARSLTGKGATYNVGRQSGPSRHSLPEELR
jgi:hypothetical protein